MSFEIVNRTQKWMSSPGELKLDVLADLDEFSRLYSREGPWEFDLIERGPEGQTLLIPVTAPSKDAGNRAAKVLADAFAEAREILSELPPDPETCEHKVVPMRFSRKLGKELICEHCLKHFGSVEEEAHVSA